MVIMTIALVAMTHVIAAAGWSFLYLLMGGGFGGAVLIFHRAEDDRTLTRGLIATAHEETIAERAPAG